jgi:hypothetical protein
MSYSDGQYKVIERKWFGLTKKFGGDGATGYTLGTTDATKIEHVARWYPRGPIRILKVGHMVLATIAGGATFMDYVPYRLRIDGALACNNVQIRKANPYVIASSVTITKPVVDAGSYITIRSATAVSDDGTDAKSATVTGTAAFFIDYVREYNSKWEYNF